MLLAISSAAAPGANLQSLVEACVHRGLAVLELRTGDSHGLGVDTSPADAAAARSFATARGISIIGLRTTSASEAKGLAALSAELEAPVILAGEEPLADRLDQARRLAAGGTTAMVEVTGPSAAWLNDITGSGVKLAWTIDTETTDPAADIAAMLAAGSLPAYIRMAGGVGAESTLGEGRGLGAVMARLTLARYAGPLVLAPGPVPYRVAWEQWLGSRGGWGCGTAAEKRDRVQLTSGIRGGST